MKIDWSIFSPTDFESFCGVILEENDFKNIVWHGASGGDRGRDLTATKHVAHLSSLSEDASWVVQCRRYVAKPPTKSEIHDWLVSCNEHKPDYALLIVTNTLSSDVKDWLKEEQKEFRFRVFLWEERDLIREVVKRKHALSARFPNIYSTGSPVEFYPMSQGEFYFSCNEFDEVQFRVFNCYDKEEAKDRVREFIDFIKANDPFVD